MKITNIAIADHPDLKAPTLVVTTDDGQLWRQVFPHKLPHGTTDFGRFEWEEIAGPVPPAPARVVVVVQGGCVQSVLSDRPAAVELIDYDNAESPEVRASMEATQEAAELQLKPVF